MSTEPHAEASTERLIALPVQIMNTEVGVILIRGVVEMRIGGERAAEVVPELIGAASGQGASRRDLIERFAAPERELVGQLIDELLKRSILVPAGSEPAAAGVESSLEVFYWHFGQRAQTAIDNLNKQPIVLMGVNTISERIALSLRSLGVERVVVVDFHVLRNLRLFDEAGTLREGAFQGPQPISYDAWAETVGTEGVACLVATSDFGGSHLMRQWNGFCVEQGVHFLPVVLDRFIGTIGPLVIPGETACYECFRLRENANMDAPEIDRAPEMGAPDRQAITGFHPAMANVLGEVAALELCKFYGGGVPFRANRVIEINLLHPSMAPRRLFRLPRCPVCSPSLKTSSFYLDKDSFVPGNQLNFHEFR